MAIDNDLLEDIIEIKEKTREQEKHLERHDAELEELKKTHSMLEKMDFRMGNVEKTVESMSAKIDKHTELMLKEQNKDSEEKGKKWDKLIDYIFYFFIAIALGFIAKAIM